MNCVSQSRHETTKAQSKAIFNQSVWMLFLELIKAGHDGLITRLEIVMSEF